MAARQAYIGRIRLKSNGAEIHLLPDAIKRQSDQAFRELAQVFGEINQYYLKELNGFAIVAWDKDARFHAFMSSGSCAVNLNILPEYVAGALRREIADDDARKIFEG
jgi:hypothetical protein